MSARHLHATPAAVEIRHFHLFCGLGGGAKGFNRGAARVGSLSARFRCIGGVDVDPASIADFGRAAGVPGTVLDMFDRDQYEAFHGKPPPAGWREATPQDLHRAAGGERPHVVFLSAPCKGFSGLLSETASRTGKYQALNRLTLRGVWLMLEAWADDPPEFILFENVPRIMNRGRPLLDRIGQLLRRYGYAVAETTHDCGELGNLGQSRKRFLLVARHAGKVPPFLYEPPKHRLRGVGEILERFPMPGDMRAGPMHRMPSLQWKTWVRLAFVEAGSDWRSLNRLRVADGVLSDYGIVPEREWQQGVLGVERWEDPACTVTSRGGPSNGAFSVADPRPEAFTDRGAYGVGGWDDPAATLTSQRPPGQGRFSVADPRPTNSDPQGNWRVAAYGEPSRAVIGGRKQGAAAVADPRIDGHHKSIQMGVGHWDQPAAVVKGDVSVGTGRYAVADPRTPGTPYNHVYRIVDWRQPSPSVTSANGGTAAAVADPRASSGFGGKGKYRVVGYDQAAGTVIASSTTGQGAFAIADPRPDSLNRDGRDGYLTQGHYGVVPWEQPAGAVPAFAKNNNGRWSVADPRELSDCENPQTDANACLPTPADRLVAVIRALDGTWHRPFTTLELAALQGLVDPEEHLQLEGLSDSAWRERIGNAVPPPAAQAIASVIGRTLLLAWTGETFVLNAEPIWVQPIAAALSVAGHRIEE